MNGHPIQVAEDFVQSIYIFLDEYNLIGTFWTLRFRIDILDYELLSFFGVLAHYLII